MNASLDITGGRVLVAGAGEPEAGVLRCHDGLIGSIDASCSDHGRVLDATDAWVVPGLVDLHGDAFERSLMPRGGVAVDLDMALADNDVQLLASGITTAYLSATDSWEPGLRSRQTLRRLVDALARRSGAPDVRLHVRHEQCNVTDVDELERWILDGTVAFLSYNDHTPGGIAGVGSPSEERVRRAGVDRETFDSTMDAAVAVRDVGADADRRLAAAARTAGCPTASHDPSDEGDLARDLDLGVAVCEFPLSMALADRYRAHGIPVLMGAPNLVRGGSHLGNLSVRDAFAPGVDLLCSDYHYPSLLAAPFALIEHLGLDAEGAWDAVARRPAEAAGFDDRGRIEPGARADVLVVEPPGVGPARVRAVVLAGEVVYQRARRAGP